MSHTEDRAPWRGRLHEIIFEADTAAGKVFDVALLICILASVVAVMMESVDDIDADYGGVLRTVEWVFTIIFTIEYVLRMISVGRPLAYARSFFGLVDLMAILPTYASLLVGGTQSLIVIRALRLVRVFRVLKLAGYVGEAAMLRKALRNSFKKITVFLLVVMTVVMIVGSLMYLIEGPANGFSSIPQAVYWSIVTMTTVGYGDVVPQTTPGKILASMIMIAGYGVIAVPTGIVTVELGRTARKVSTQSCPQCSSEGHDANASFCKKCGASLGD